MSYSGADREDVVKRLQEMLTELGFDLGSSGVDGDFGTDTEKALRQFQQQNTDWEGKQLKSDGLLGPRTSDALNRKMVGRVESFNCYLTPVVLTQDFILINVTHTSLRKGIILERPLTSMIKIILKEGTTSKGKERALIIAGGECQESEQVFSLMDDDKLVVKNTLEEVDVAVAFKDSMETDNAIA